MAKIVQHFKACLGHLYVLIRKFQFHSQLFVFSQYLTFLFVCFTFLSSVQCVVGKDFLYLCRLLLQLIHSSLSCTEVFSFMKSHLPTIDFASWVAWVFVGKYLHVDMYLLLFYVAVSVPGLLVHLEFIYLSLKFRFSAGRYLDFLAAFVWDVLFSPVSTFEVFIKNQLVVVAWQKLNILK